MNKSHEFKVLMLGDAGVGKTCLLHRFTENRYTGYYVCTFGIGPRMREIEIAGHKVKLIISDTSGEERYHSLMSSYYRKVEGIVLVYDTTQRTSYRHVDYWLAEIKKYAVSNVSIILVGNKCDAFHDRQVSQETADRYANSLNIPFLETSAVTGFNVERLFSKMAVHMFDEQMERHLSNMPRGIFLDRPALKANKKLTTRITEFCC